MYFSHGTLLYVLSDGYILPWNCVRGVLHPEPLHMGQTFIGSRSVLNDGIVVADVVRNLPSSCLFGILLRLQETTFPATCEDQSNTSSSSRPTVVHESSLMVSGLPCVPHVGTFLVFVLVFVASYVM